MATSGITSMSGLERSTCKITIGGVTYSSIEEYKKIKKAEKKAAEKAAIEKAKADGKHVPTRRIKKRKVKEIGVVAEQIEKMIKPMGTLKSIQVYQSHAYRSWGTIANEILAHKGISKPMSSYCVKFSEMNSLIADIEKMAKRNEKAAYQYVEKMAWKLDDMKTDILNLLDGIEKSGVCERFKHHEAIYGKGRQLGLQTVANKCLRTISQIEDIVGTLQKIADNGTDPFSYGDHMSARTRARCWA